MAGHPRFKEILIEIQKLHDAKNADYTGDGGPLQNLKLCEMAGIPAWKGVVIRLTDKMSRLLTFSKIGELKVKDESVIDTFTDMAVYAILGRILYEETKKEKHDEDIGR